MVGSGIGAKNGILFKTAASLEAAGRTDIVVLDKTGTITAGEPRVTDVIPAGDGRTRGSCCSRRSRLSRKASTPLARAIMRYGEERGLAAPEAAGFAALPGNGVRAVLDGEELHGGSAGVYLHRRPDTRRPARRGGGPLRRGQDAAVLRARRQALRRHRPWPTS